MIEFIKDPNILLLLHGEGFVDSSGNGFSITNNGVTISTSQSKFGGSSFYFNGGAYLTAPGYDFGAEDFTIDWWEYATSNDAGTRFTSNFCQTYSTQAGGILLHANESGLKVYASDTTNNNWNLIKNQPSGANALNEWIHRAVVRSGNTLMLFVNGTLEYSYTLSGPIGHNSALPMGIGGWAVDGPGPNYFFAGYIDEFRVSNIARWTANFTPPTEPYTDGLIAVTPGGVIPQNYALRRRMMMQAGILPSGYTQVDYIQGTGSQYIDTGFLVNKNDNYALEVDAAFDSQTQAYQGCNGYMQFYVSSVYGISANSAKAVGNRDIVKIAYANQTAVLSVNGVQIESKSWASYSGANVKLGVLRMGDTNNGWFNGGAASGTIYGYKVWENSEFVSECIPCIRNSDNVAGMYDIVRKQFIQNAGTGEFYVAGSIPSEHTVTVSGYQNGYTVGATVGGNSVGIGNTVTVVDGTSCTITILPNMNRYCKVTLNGTTVLSEMAESSRPLSYTFSITNNTTIYFCLYDGYPTAQITM